MSVFKQLRRDNLEVVTCLKTVFQSKYLAFIHMVCSFGLALRKSAREVRRGEERLNTSREPFLAHS